MTSRWTDRFPPLAALEDGIAQSLHDNSQLVRIAAGTEIFAPGKHAEHMVLLLEGTVRVLQSAENGREIVLYRVQAGETCVLTTATLLAYGDYEASGITETDITAVLVPGRVFEDLLARSAIFRRFIFAACFKRISEMFQVVEEVAFRRVDLRLAERLLALAGARDSIHLTHQQLASELGTAREVVSRQLQEFQRRGWIATARGEIRIADPDGLRRFIASEGALRG
ncbi:MAG: Crp/Fnr family transcriptional regulator [Neomegalonema sp.]|nr:Crp/Fnr family transcriptional regulator [Neomegalonema sp.]